MRNPEITVTTYLDKRVTKKDGTHPVKIRVTYKRKQKYYSIKNFIKNISPDFNINYNKLSFTQKEFDRIQTKKPSKEYKEYKKLFNAVELYLYQLITDIKKFSFDELKNRIYETENFTNDLKELFANKIKELYSKDRISTAKTYNATLNSLIYFHSKPKLLVENITVKFLKDYENYMLKNNKSYTTIGIYMRNLRHILNIAINNKVIDKELYPFGQKENNKYSIPESRNIKKALTIDEVKKIFEYAPISKMEQSAKDFWVFSYLCNGMNISDIAYLKFKNLKDGKIQFYRKKTKSTSKRKKLITVILTDETKEIIKRIGNEPTPENYIFNILQNDYTPQKEFTKIKQHIKNINKYLKIIAKKIYIDEGITTYWARHTYSTVLKRSGTPISFISEQLGHHSLKTTDNYLDSFQDDTIQEFSKQLTNFK